LAPGQPFYLRPGEFALGVTEEWIAVPEDLVARLDGKSSLGRLGLLIHATAGLVDPGWEGRLTLELANLAPFPITLFVGMKIGQISFIQMTTPVDVPYGRRELSSKYQGDREPTPSRYHLEF
jgi:dCTP deaminase